MALAPYNTSYPDEPGTAGAEAKELEEAQSVAGAMSKQHPFHGMMGRTFERLGGEDFLYDWAEENPTKFVEMMMKLAPAAIPKGQTGGIHLHVHNDLQPGALDVAQGEVFENEAE